MKKHIAFLFLLFNSLISYSIGNSLVGPTTVDPGTYYTYRVNLEGWDINTKVNWKITNGHFNNVNGPVKLTQAIGGLDPTVVWDDTTNKGVITIDINGPFLLRIEVNINSVKNMHITDFRYNGNKAANDVINLPPEQTGTLVCTVPDMEYPITKRKINEFKWSTPKSWGGKTFYSSGTIRVNYNANTGNNETITVTPLGFGDALGNTKTITIKRTSAPPVFDGNIKNVTITSNKTYKYSNLYAENVTIKSGANVVMNGYNSVRIVPGFTAELGSTVRIYNGTATIWVPVPKDGLSEREEVKNRLIEDKKAIKMEQNNPNPAKESTIVNCFISSETTNAYIQIFNTMGGVVQKIPVTTMGQSEIYIDTNKLPNGIYIYSLFADGRLVDTKRMIVAN